MVKKIVLILHFDQAVFFFPRRARKKLNAQLEKTSPEGLAQSFISCVMRTMRVNLLQLRSWAFIVCSEPHSCEYKGIGTWRKLFLFSLWISFSCLS